MHTQVEKLSTAAQLLAAIAVLLAVPIGLLQLRGISDQIEAIERQSAMDVLLRIEDRLNSSTLQTAFDAYRDHKEDITAAHFLGDDELGQSLRVMGNFYESIAICVNKGYFSYDDARRLLGGDLVNYYHKTERAISDLRKKRNQPEILLELETLARRVRQEKGFHDD